MDVAVPDFATGRHVMATRLNFSHISRFDPRQCHAKQCLRATSKPPQTSDFIDEPVLDEPVLDEPVLDEPGLFLYTRRSVFGQPIRISG